MSTPNDMTGVGIDGSTKQPTDKYDSEHGKYSHNVPAEPNLPNPGPAGPDPSPFRVGNPK